MNDPRAYCCYCRESIYDNVDERREVVCGDCVQALLGYARAKIIHHVAPQREIRASRELNVMRKGNPDLPLTWEEANE